MWAVSRIHRDFRVSGAPVHTARGAFRRDWRRRGRPGMATHLCHRPIVESEDLHSLDPRKRSDSRASGPRVNRPGWGVNRRDG